MKAQTTCLIDAPVTDDAARLELLDADRVPRVQQSIADHACGGVANQLRASRESFRDVLARRGAVAPLLSAIERAWHEASRPDWNGEGGVQMTETARDSAKELALSLPEWATRPEASADPEGGVLLEWWFGRGRSLVAAVTNDGSLVFSFGLDGATQSATERLVSGMPAAFLRALRRLHRATARDRI